MSEQNPKHPTLKSGVDWDVITQQLREQEQRTTGTDVVIRSGGQPELVDPQGSTTRLSRLPAERMAAGDDHTGVIELQPVTDDAGMVVWSDVSSHDGRMIGTASRGATAQAPLSRLPSVRMAAVNPAPHVGDVGELPRLDPDNVEQWTPATAGLLNGWKFRLRPEPGAPEYVFFAFRSPLDSNNFRVFVISPNVDDSFGHHAHMIATVVGAKRIPVICGPKGASATSLEEARLHAAKWMYYHYLRALGRDPRFSA